MSSAFLFVKRNVKMGEEVISDDHECFNVSTKGEIALEVESHLLDPFFAFCAGVFFIVFSLGL